MPHCSQRFPAMQGPKDLQDGEGNLIIGAAMSSSREPDFRAGVRRDMLDLSDLMCRTLLLHLEDKSETHLDTERILEGLVTFIRKLRKVYRFEPDYLEWLLDDSAFWTGAQKSTFMQSCGTGWTPCKLLTLKTLIYKWVDSILTGGAASSLIINPAKSRNISSLSVGNIFTGYSLVTRRKMLQRA
ncbi:hypothetical protein RHSIM_Rhsim01G0088600 [Rhododendron simsii]|uniref:Uncharacterized protein n=1 Tax=Rhododendron simsii TaxID=118357 RepID=A0A834HHI6_RHOSS|nr:hypothetical protein RHSIM_Rhsim01G0088600 [Rhododendron simsii]